MHGQQNVKKSGVFWHACVNGFKNFSSNNICYIWNRSANVNFLGRLLPYSMKSVMMLST